jgi:hypothetical protein
MTQPTQQLNAAGTAQGDADVGGYTVNEFADLFRICRSLVYSEVRRKRLKLSKIRSRSIITKTEARKYQARLDREAAG